FALTAYGDVQAPTRSTTDFAGEKGVVISPTLASDVVLGRVRLGASTGARVRPVAESFLGERQGTQLVFAGGASVDTLPRELLSIGVEAQSLVGLGARSRVVSDAFGVRTDGSARAIVGGEWLASLRTAISGKTLALVAGGGATLPGGGLFGIGETRAVL